VTPRAWVGLSSFQLHRGTTFCLTCLWCVPEKHVQFRMACVSANATLQCRSPKPCYNTLKTLRFIQSHELASRIAIMKNFKAQQWKKDVPPKWIRVTMQSYQRMQFTYTKSFVTDSLLFGFLCWRLERATATFAPRRALFLTSAISGHH
jgi:hypothetical protein